jgi:hypothetical protein
MLRVIESVQTPLWLRVFAITAIVAVFGSLGFMFLSGPKKAPAPTPAPALAMIEAPPAPRSSAPVPAPVAPVASIVKPAPAPVATAPVAAVPKAVIDNWQTPDGPALATEFFNRWAAQDSAAAGRWLVAQPDSPARHAGAEAVAETWARKDLTAATEWALALPDTGIMKSVVLDRLATTWVEKDPLIGAGHYAKLPAGDLRRLAATALFERWSQRDPSGMHAALAKIPPQISDDARMSLAPVLFPRSSTEAMNVLCDVVDREQRIHSLNQMFDYWRRRNRGASIAWLANSPLSTEDRQRVSGL